MSEDEIINRLKRIIDISYTKNFATFELMYQDVDAIKGLLDLYKTEKELSENRYKEIVRLSNEIGYAKEEIKNLNNLLDMKKEINNDLEKRLSDLELHILEE